MTLVAMVLGALVVFVVAVLGVRSSTTLGTLVAMVLGVLVVFVVAVLVVDILRGRRFTTLGMALVTLVVVVFGILAFFVVVVVILGRVVAVTLCQMATSVSMGRGGLLKVGSILKKQSQQENQGSDTLNCRDIRGLAGGAAETSPATTRVDRTAETFMLAR